MLACWGDSICVPNLTLCVVLGLSAALCEGSEALSDGKVLQMESVQCGVAERAPLLLKKSGNAVRHKKTQEYLPGISAAIERVIYRIRPRNEKHAVLLSVNERAQFRLQKDKMLLRVRRCRQQRA